MTALIVSPSPASALRFRMNRAECFCVIVEISKKTVDNCSRMSIYRYPTMKDELNTLIPLSSAVLYILLALSGKDCHGYGIMREIARQSDGRYKLGPGTLYDNLQRLEEQGIVEESAQRSSAEESRRRYYRLTRFGRRLLSAEIDRLEGVIREARQRLRPRPERAG